LAGGRPPAGLSDRPEPGSGPGVSSARPAAVQAVVQVVSWCMWLGRVVGSASPPSRVGVGVGRPEPAPPWPACGATRPPPADAVRSMCRASGPSPAVSRGPLALPPSLTRPLFTLSLSLSLSLRPHSLASRYGQGEGRASHKTHESRARPGCGGAEAEHSQQRGQRTRNGGSICPAPFSFHVTRTWAALHVLPT
jgi:hypothetical protein